MHHPFLLFVAIANLGLFYLNALNKRPVSATISLLVGSGLLILSLVP